MGRPRLGYPSAAAAAGAHATTHLNDFVIRPWLNGSLHYRNRNGVRREEDKSYIGPDENQTSSGWSVMYIYVPDRAVLIHYDFNFENIPFYNRYHCTR